MSEPTRRERYRPAELIALSAFIGLFGGLVVLLVTRDPIFAVVAFGISFIVTLVSIALLILAIKPDDAERSDIDEQNSAH